MMKTPRTLLLAPLLVLLPLAGAGAATYKCVDNGRVSYQGTPCKNGTGSAVNVVPPEDAAAAASRGTAEDPSAIAARFEAQSKALAAERRLRDIDYEIKALELEISQNQSAMKSELDALQQKKDYWKNQLGGSTWVQSTEEEIKNVSEKYKPKIQAAQDKLNALNQEKAQLKGQLPRKAPSESGPKE